MVKRGADDQISEYTNFEKLESEAASGSWESADPEELARRRIVKIKRTTGNAVNKVGTGTEGAPSTSKGPQGERAAANPFSGVKLVAPSVVSIASSVEESHGNGETTAAGKLPAVSTEIANNTFTKSPEKSGTSLSSGGLSISIPSPSTATGQHSNKSWGGSSPAINSTRSASTLTPGSRTPGGGKKVNPFSGQSPKANPNPFLSVQDEGNINNDMWRKLSGSNTSSPGAAGSAGIAAAPKATTAASATGASIPPVANPFIAPPSASDGASTNVFAAGFSGFASVTGGGEPEGVFSEKSSGVLGSSSNGDGGSGSGGVGIGSVSAGLLGGGLRGTTNSASSANGAGGGSSWLFNKSSGSSFLSSIKETKVEALFGAKSSSSSSSSSGSSSSSSSGGSGGSSSNGGGSGGDEAAGDLFTTSPAFVATSSSGSSSSGSSSGGSGGSSRVAFVATSSATTEAASQEAGASTGAGGVQEDDGAAEAQSEEHTLNTAYGKTYAMVGGPVLTGEEGENCLLQVRAKLFKLTVCVPAKADNSDEEGEDEGKGGAREEKEKEKETEGKEQMEWAEVGVGPLRVLKAKDGPAARLVMRREDKKGGGGTKVILNIKIREYTSARTQGEKALCVSTFVPVAKGEDEGDGEGELSSSSSSSQASAPVSYMLRCKLATETAQLASAIEEEVGRAKA